MSVFVFIVNKKNIKNYYNQAHITTPYNHVNRRIMRQLYVKFITMVVTRQGYVYWWGRVPHPAGPTFSK